MINEINEELELNINNEYNYSNSLPVVELITYLVQYCDKIYKNFVNLIEEDEKKNEQFKHEYRNYKYKKNFGERFEIYIREKNYNGISCKDLSSFEKIVNDGKLKNINSLEIRMNLNYDRGKYMNLIKHENHFHISFKPYEIIFTRNSNYNEIEMNKIEDTIKDVLNKFPVVNTIFCTK